MPSSSSSSAWWGAPERERERMFYAVKKLSGMDFVWDGGEDGWADHAIRGGNQDEREKRVVTIAWSDSLKKLFKNEYIHIGEAPSSSPSTSPCFGTQDALINLHDESIKMPIVKPLLAYMVYCTLLYAFLHPLHTYCLHICSFITLLRCRNNNNKWKRSNKIVPHRLHVEVRKYTQYTTVPVPYLPTRQVKKAKNN